MPSAKILGTSFDVPGNSEKRLETRKKVRKQSWSHRFNCGSRFFASAARCGRVDLVRRLELRLVYSKTNLRRAKDAIQRVRRASLRKTDLRQILRHFLEY